MIRIVSETRVVYRSEVGRRARLTKRTAYLDAAWHAWKAKYPCTCDPETSYVCSEHEDRQWTATDPEASDERGEYRRKVIDRLARWLMWRDARAVQVSHG